MLKEGLPFKYNMTANPANGCLGYIPIRELFQPDIYEARLCSLSNLIPDAGYIITEKLLGLADKLKNQRMLCILIMRTVFVRGTF